MPSFLPNFVRLAIVNILSNLMVPLAGLIDTAFLGHLDEIHHLAGVALATVIFNYVYWTFGFLRISTTGMTAQAVGRDDSNAVWLVALRHILLGLGLGCLIMLLQVPLRSIGFTLLSATPEVKASGQSYYNALIWGAPATLIGFVLLGWFLGRAQGHKVLLLSFISSSSNVLLDYVFIVRWGWGSAGAGWATAISQYLLLVVGLGLMVQEPCRPPLKTIASQLYDPLALKAAFTLNREIMVRTLALVTTFSVFTNLSSLLGTTVLTANTVMLQVVTLAAYFIDGIAFATESFAGLFYGQRATHSLLYLMQVAGGASLALGLSVAGGFIVFPDRLFGLLTDHQSVLDRLHDYVLWLLPVLGFGALAYMLDGYFVGLTQGRVLRVASLYSSLLGFAPVAIVAWQLHSDHLLWLALAVFMAARTLTLGVRVPATLDSDSISDPN
ncbi:guanitoxin biosynthesis MATE family efflux transporter GntT [Thermocoleostomius sinensis]|uniref:MATE family efflux transporter n=1 Tax=Thermocoleostomius sinensis A174 TaxID=2016057 RepID=A0A9E8Z989_9CYAN|nr:guanitoxin biosynthesis MATE family efflux transporter GntT [Thermocoleostomius sinensis]WAL58627.1 MATE family efflux transporter [Thermocoleostomius sinensis A174]